MGITLKQDKLQSVIHRVCYQPHPDVFVGKVSCCACGGDNRDDDDTNIIISLGCRLDITGNITIGKWVMIGNGAHLITHVHNLTGREPLLLKEESVEPGLFTIRLNKIIGDDVWIFDSTILPQCQNIAQGVIIGSGSIVTKSIDEKYSIWAGNPARKIGER